MVNGSVGPAGAPVRRRLAWAWAPVVVLAIGACASRPPPAAKRSAVGVRPPVQQPASTPAVPSARPQVRVTPGAAGGPAAGTQGITAVPLPPLTAADRAAARAAAAPAVAPPAASPPASPQSAADPPVSSPPDPAAIAPAAPPVLPGDDVSGQPVIHLAKYEDTLLDLAIDKGFGFLEIRAANPDVDPWLPGAGTQVLLPYARILPNGPRNGLLLNLPEQRLFLFKKGRLVDSFPIGVFRDGFSTPIGSTTIVRKVVNPTWYPTASARRDDPTLPAVVHPGPDNPLGTRAMYLGWPMYLIHGTHKPYGVGRRVSRGCIRLYPADAERLYDLVAVGTPVHVVNQPIKIGWWRGELFVQAHPTLQQGIALEETGKVEPIEIPDISGKIEAKAGPAAGRVDWPTVERVLRERRGYPVQVTAVERPVADLPATAAQPPATAATALIR